MIELEQKKLKDVSVWELICYLKHRLMYTITNINEEEAEHAIKALKDYQQAWRKRHNIPEVKPEYPLKRNGE